MLVVALLAMSLVQTPRAEAKPRPKCFGKKATIVGDAKANVLKGTKKADVIVGLGGNDRILGRGGADRICGGPGKDRLLGGGGNDHLDGGPGKDYCQQLAGTGQKKSCEGPKLQLTMSKVGSGSGTVTSSPTGIDCGPTCGQTFLEAEIVTLSATASSGSTFTGWGGACSESGPCSVVMGKAQSVVATFTANPAPPPPPTFSLAVTTSGSGSGTISSSPGGINCGADCSEAYTQGTAVTLSAAPAANSVFDGWSGACSGTGNCVVAMDAAKSLNAAFTKVTYNMHVDRAFVGTGASGTVTSAPTGINCGSDCDEVYDQGTSLTLTATAGSGSRFSSWSGCDSGTGNPCSISLTSARTATATFVKVYDLGVTKDGGTGSGTVTSSPAGVNCGPPSTCTATFDEGSSVTLTATPNAGSRFDSWTSGCDSISGNQCTVNMSGPKSVNATFTRIWSLTVTKDGGSGNGAGTVSSSPSGIDCGSTCSANFDQGTSVALTPIAAAGSRFGSWSGCDSVGPGNQCNVSITGAKSVTATFVKVWDLTVTKNGGSGNGAGTVTSDISGINCASDCSETYDHGTIVTLTAVASAGSRFDGWSDPACPGTGTCVVTMDAAKSVTATFVKEWVLTMTKDGGSGNGTGTVVSDVSGINCGTSCTSDTGTYDHGTVVTLTATAASGSRFGGWSDPACPGTGTCVVTMDAAKSVTATFIKQWDLTVTVTGSGSGSVQSSPSGINSCTTLCTATFDQGTVTLTANADDGSVFTGWSGSGCGGTGTCIVTMNEDKSVTANFTLGRTLTVTKPGTGGGTVTSDATHPGIECGSECTATYLQGESVTLTAAPDGTSTFTGWGGACSGTGTCIVLMDDNKSVTATFTRIIFNLHIDITPTGPASGSVTSTPGINCTVTDGIGGGDCNETHITGTEVTLTASPQSGHSRFVQWGGACSGTLTACTLTMTADKTVTAMFIKLWTLTVVKNGAVPGTVTSTSNPPGPGEINCGPTCTATYDHGTEVTLSQSGGVAFQNWTGACTGTGTNCGPVTMNANKTVNANWLG